jgi:hypothetical protein
MLAEQPLWDGTYIASPEASLIQGMPLWQRICSQRLSADALDPRNQYQFHCTCSTHAPPWVSSPHIHVCGFVCGLRMTRMLISHSACHSPPMSWQVSPRPLSKEECIVYFDSSNEPLTSAAVVSSGCSPQSPDDVHNRCPTQFIKAGLFELGFITPLASQWLPFVRTLPPLRTPLTVLL